MFRYAVILILILAGFTACKTPKPLAMDNENGKIGSANESDEPSAAKFQVTGIVTHSGQYCGGAAPSREMLEEMRLPKPYSGKKFYFRRGETNNIKLPIVDSVLTNSEGKFQIQLQSGKYCLLLPEQKDSTWFKSFRKSNSSIVITDEKCLKDWFEKGYLTFSVAEASAPMELKIHLEKYCFLPEGMECLDYTGPYPP